MTARSTVSLIIPALNEEAAIGVVLSEVPLGIVDEVIVVDNGSTDRTAAVAAHAGARVVREAQRGYGAACLAGSRAARGDTLLFLDGDRSDHPQDAPAVLAPLLANQADLVLGSRAGPGREAGALPRHQRAGNRVATTLLRVLFGLRLSDIGSFRAIRRDTLLDLGIRNLTYGWPVEMVVCAARKQLRVVEVPIHYRRRIGESKVGGTVWGSVRAGVIMMQTILRQAIQ